MTAPDAREASYAHVLVLHAGAAWGEHQHAPIFIYAIPAALRDQLAPGQSLLVPYGPRLVSGILWALGPWPQTAPDLRAVREISAILDPLPLLDEVHRALAAWLAEAYVCSLPDAVRLIAPGMTTQPHIELQGAIVTPDGAPLVAVADEADTRALLGLLGEQGHADEAVVRRALGAKRAGALIAALEARGALTRVARATTPHAATTTFLQLVADATTVTAWRGVALAQLAGPPPAPRRTRAVASNARAARGRGALLQRIAMAGGAVTAPPIAPLPSRELVRLRAAIAILDLLQSTATQTRPQREVLRMTRATPAALAIVLDAGLVTSQQSETEAQQSPLPAEDPLDLTGPQATAVTHIIAALDAATELAAWGTLAAAPDAATLAAARPILLHGITGSGKTEVYLQALAAAIARGRRGIVLVPEIALTPQTVSRFAARFPGRVALLHSALRPAERQREWRRIRAGAVDVVIGSRSAIFAPIADLGLIILDEEHDTSYKHDQRPPTYHAREVAMMLAQLTGAAVVLGSATPATESYFHAQQGDYALLTLTERPAGRSHAASATARATQAELPTVSIIDLREELHAAHTSILSRALLTAMETTLARGEQVILFLNRRGSATCVLCRDCGYVARCGRCDVPLTHHQHEDTLLCHYCGWHETPPRICLRCGGTGIRFFGVGTERVEATVRERFPRARVLRWDADTVHGYMDHERFGKALADRQVDILIGTQMIAKGLDVPSVTLVGIVAADVALFLPDYHAPERAFQLLTQVAGRAGRGAAPGRVLLQTFSPEHFCIEAAARHDFRAFYDVEIATRQAYGYPPFRRFVKLTFTHKDRHACQIEAISLGDHLTRLIDDLGLVDTDIVGPAPAFIERLRNRYRWQMILRGPDPRAVIAALAPGELGAGWAVDIDPTSSL